jgi:hypothetical protein
LKRPLLALALVAIPTVAHADPVDQDNQLVFGLAGTYAPTQNNLGTDVFALGHYVSYTHALDCFHAGLRFAVSVGTGPQYLVDPSGFIGLHYRTGRLALRLDVGTGVLWNGGDGIQTVIVEKTYARAALQVRVVKSVIVEANAGPGFILGSSVVGVLAEFGIGVGWNF